ncbi:MAG TPA: 50S ribosomal protein L7/L12 [Rhabdochlamydiaceae bacterium]
MSTQHIEDLVETLSKLTVMDMSKLKTMLEDKWGVKAAAAAPMMMAAPAAGGGADAAAAEATDFQIVLEASPADKKIGVIKIVREITGLGLKEAKDLVDGAPKTLKESSPKAEAEEISKKVAAAGGKVTLKGL